MSAWGRNYGRLRKCGKRRTTPDGAVIVCRLRSGHDDPRNFSPGPTEHEGRSGGDLRVWVWGLEPRAPLRPEEAR